MKAWTINKIEDLRKETRPLRLTEIPDPEPGEGQLLLRVRACGVCHTEIDEIEGRTAPPRYPVVPGHQVVGVIEENGRNAGRYKTGDRVGVAWIWSACGRCEYCLSGRENLCSEFKATGRDVNGGYAEYMVVPEKYVYPIPGFFTDSEAAPLLCAGAVGYRSVSLTGMSNGSTAGLTGFGASGHLVMKLIRYQYPQSKVFVFARSEEERKFALELGAVWAGDTSAKPPVLLDCIIDTTPVWEPVIRALECLKPGGRLVINAIRKESSDNEILSRIDYSSHLWMEKEIKSVANVTSEDVSSFIKLATEMEFKPDTEIYPFYDANKALLEIKNRRIHGAKVLTII